MRKLSTETLEFFRLHGARGGRLGGKQAAANMTAAERKARATKASLAAVKARAKAKRSA